MKRVLPSKWLMFYAIILCSCVNHRDLVKNSQGNSFNMVFMTDIHLQPELNAVKGFRQAMDSVNKLKPDFVITGGDLIMYALEQKQSRADSLYDLYIQESKKLEMPVYNTIGNHELFGVYPKSGVDTTHRLYGNKMFREKIGKTYYSFQYKNWKFLILDDIFATPERAYTGFIPPDEKEWIEKELFDTNPRTPIAIILHIPMLTSLTQFNKGALEPNNKGFVVNNSREILNLFEGYNLKLVLQGHLHVLEDNYIKNVHFITGGAICGGWWKGPNEGTQEGFLFMSFKGEEFTWRYVDYGWTPEKSVN